MRSFVFGGTAGACLSMLVLLSAVCGPATAANVVLKDGTVIHGEVVSLKDGVYTVRTDSLGTVRVRKQEVRSIDESEGSPNRSGPDSSAQGAPPQAGGLQGLQLGILQDPKLLEMLLALQNDPGVQAVLGDPKIMSEIAAGDYTALMNDPKIAALLSDEKVRALIDEVR